MTYFIVNAFTGELFSGNPAGVCFPESWPSDALMQKIARENGLPETAFAVKGPDGWSIRWFTPAFEMDLCGHATLAAGFCIMSFVEPGSGQVSFNCRSGSIAVERQGQLFALNFPSRPPLPIETHRLVEASLGARVLECHQSRDMLAVLENAETVKNLAPNFDLMRGIPGTLGIIPTAKGDDCDFVSRYFDPCDDIFEDPVTGSAHCTLIPFWAQRLGKKEMVARQLSARGGTLLCADMGERVQIAGQAVLYLRGQLEL